jgi:hypothetical protein
MVRPEPDFSRLQGGNLTNSIMQKTAALI